jgi:hypothetical protein
MAPAGGVDQAELLSTASRRKPGTAAVSYDSAMTRGDLSNRLIHLTSGESMEGAFQRFLSILTAGRLLASDRNIRGGFKCVCFSEAPIAVLAQMLVGEKSRYMPFGVMLDKAWLFAKGGRPVIYQSEAEYECLPEPLRYRHVRYEPGNGVDWTWEREWRIPGDVIFRPNEVTLIVPVRDFPDFPKEVHRTFPKEPGAIIPRFNSLEWHYVALSDLGVTVEM